MWLDSLGVKSVDEAAIKLAPLFTEFENRMRGVAYESLERFNGATIDLEIIDKKVRVTVNLQPVSPPSVKEQ
jgi:hypothetical protein